MPTRNDNVVRADTAARRLCRISRAAALAPLAFVFAAAAAIATPLDDYVAKPDPAFKYTKIGDTELANSTTSIYHMVSQNWLDKSKVDRPLWEHSVTIAVPAEVKYTKAMMFIGGGGNEGGYDKLGEENGPLEKIAVATKSIVVVVKQIPNQPLHFVGEHDPKYKESGRREDELITYGWDKFMTNGDPAWLPRLPMTKAVVRAMDLAQKEFPKIDGFFVAGASKRGWTTWNVAAVDKRVIGIAPVVIDCLNFEKSLQNHHDVYGFWAPAIENYVETKIVDRIHTPEMKNLLKVVDPYSYLDRLTMPKYIMNGSGDQYFTLDSSKLYFDDLKGEKYLCYFPNADHSLNAEAYFLLASFYEAVLAKTPLPKFAWKRADDGSLSVKCETKPTKAQLWKAYNPDARDFRLATLGKKFESTPLTESAPGVYASNVKPADKGWTAFFIELEFPNPDFSTPFRFTTGVSVVPDTYPGKDKK